MAQEIANYLLPIAVLLMILGFNDARQARKRLRLVESRLTETEEHRRQLIADLEDRDRSIAHLQNAVAGAERQELQPIPDFASVSHEGMAYFVAGGRVLRSPILDNGLFVLSDAVPADPMACSDLNPGLLLEITIQLGR
jgi:hypothetical protein